MMVSHLMVDCLGLRWCLYYSMENNLSNLSIEMDTEPVVYCLNGPLCKRKLNILLFLIVQIPSPFLVNVML